MQTTETPEQQRPCYSFATCQPPSSSTGAGLTGWATVWTRADEYTGCRDAVRLFGSGNAGDGIELGFVSGRRGRIVEFACPYREPPACSSPL